MSPPNTDNNLLSKSDFIERIRLLSDVREKRRRIFDRNPRYLLVLFSIPVLTAGIAGYIISMPNFEYWKAQYFWIPIIVLGGLGLISGLLLPPYIRGWFGLILSLFAIFCFFYCQCLMWVADCTAVDVLYNMIYELIPSPSFLVFMLHMPLMALLFALSRCLEVFPRNGTCRLLSLILGVTGVIILILSLFFVRIRIDDGDFFIRIVNAYFGVVLIKLHHTKSRDAQAGIAKLLKISRISIITVIFIFSIRPFFFNLQYTVLNIALGFPILLTITTLSDFIGQLAYHWWVKKADTELSRMQQEIANFE
jgi:MFS family permease